MKDVKSVKELKNVKNVEGVGEKRVSVDVVFNRTLFSVMLKIQTLWCVIAVENCYYF